MSFRWHGIVGSVGIIGAVTAPGLIGGRWMSAGEPRLAGASAPRRVAVVDSLNAPEAVSYDSTHDVYLVSNINGTPQVKDGNGFISRISSDGKMDSRSKPPRGQGADPRRGLPRVPRDARWRRLQLAHRHSRAGRSEDGAEHLLQWLESPHVQPWLHPARPARWPVRWTGRRTACWTERRTACRSGCRAAWRTGRSAAGRPGGPTAGRPRRPSTCGPGRAGARRQRGLRLSQRSGVPRVTGCGVPAAGRRRLAARRHGARPQP
jgi:hypothetical protein